MKCFCQSGQNFSDCCQPFIQGQKLPVTAEQLMRSRFSAYCDGSDMAMQYVANSYHPLSQKDNPLSEITAFAKAAHFIRLEVISASDGEHGGYKEIIASVQGEGAYGTLKFESGGHRVQRVPATESQGRVHTSACTVAIMPEIPESEAIEINPADLKVDTYRASGAGGQHVNRTDSAIRITHLPTGIVVECQDERSQHKNRARAMSVLASRIQAAEDEKRRLAEESTRRSLVGSGDRSERIRTYNFPQGRLTDHRINLTIYRLNEVMEGDLDQVLEPLKQEHQADLLAALADENR